VPFRIISHGIINGTHFNRIHCLQFVRISYHDGVSGVFEPLFGITCIQIARAGANSVITKGGESQTVPKNTPLAIDVYLLWKGRRGVLSSLGAGGPDLVVGGQRCTDISPTVCLYAPVSDRPFSWGR